MSPERLQEITARYPKLRVAIIGDFCLDRYLEIDPTLGEVSIETGLPVHNVVRVRAQPGAAGTILANLAALGVGAIYPIGNCGDDGEGYELLRALRSVPAVALDYFKAVEDRVTFTYCKPLVLEPGGNPRELNRLDTKNWRPAPREEQDRIDSAITQIAETVDALVLMDQVDVAETGVCTESVRRAAYLAQQKRPELVVLADSRRSLRDFPPLTYKMNLAELAAFTNSGVAPDEFAAREQATRLALQTHRPVFVTMAERGIVAALPDGAAFHSPSLPARGAIDIVGAGDSVTANLAAALGAGASPSEALPLAMAAASHVIHQLGTTGAASVADISRLLFPGSWRQS